MRWKIVGTLAVNIGDILSTFAMVTVLLIDLIFLETFIWIYE